MDKDLRKQLVDYLSRTHAHMDLQAAVKAFPMSKINTKAPNSTYTPYRLLEHIRISQWDILNFIQNPKYIYLKWPDDYWPKEGKKATPADWKKSTRLFKKDLAEIIKHVKNPKTNLLAKIPHGTGQTLFREIVVVLDHNAYHIGEFGILRDVMKTWGKNKNPI